MKKVFKFMVACACAAVCAVGASACSDGSSDVKGKSTLLATPAKAQSIDYDKRMGGEFNNYLSSVESFSAKFTDAAYKNYDWKGNVAFSPVSVYMALSLASQCSDGDTKAQILSALGTDDITLKNNFSELYSGLNDSFENSFKILATNSVWTDTAVSVDAACANNLAKNFYCYPYTADFARDNAAANRSLSDFVKDKTKGLIDKEFNLTPETIFALVNTLYLKDVWNRYGDDIALYNDNIDFKQIDGKVVNTKMLQAGYQSGRVHESDSFKSFHAYTNRGLNIKFIVPKEGHSLSDVFTESNISEANSVKDYGGYDESINTYYYTRCIFPQFTAEYDGELIEILKENFGITDMFDPAKADFSVLTSQPAYCTKVAHATKLKVDRKGIEGAAVTVIAGEASAAGPDERKEVFADFIVDKAFGYVVTDRFGTTLFSGVVGEI